MTREKREIKNEDSCFFCEEAKNPNSIIFENNFFYSRLDRFPVSPGHTEVISKRHVESLMDLTQNEWLSLHEALTETVHLIEVLDFRKIYTEFPEIYVNTKSAWFCQKMLEHPGIDKKPDGYNFGNNDGLAAGITIHHLHVHIIPRFFGDVEYPRGGIRHIIPGMGNYK